MTAEPAQVIEEQQQTVSARAVELVRAKISNAIIIASDSDVARALGVSRGAVWAYKTGRDSMSDQVLLKVQQAAGLGEAEFIELMFDALIEGDPPDVRFLQKAKKRTLRALRRAAREAMSILLPVLIGALLSKPGISRAAAPAALIDEPATVYYVISCISVGLNASCCRSHEIPVTPPEIPREIAPSPSSTRANPLRLVDDALRPAFRRSQGVDN